MSKLSTPRHNLLKKKCVEAIKTLYPLLYTRIKAEVETELHQRRKSTMSPANRRANFIRQECVRWMKTHAIHNFHKIEQAAEKKFPTDPKYTSKSLNMKQAWKKGAPSCTNLKAAQDVHISIDQP